MKIEVCEYGRDDAALSEVRDYPKLSLKNVATSSPLCYLLRIIPMPKVVMGDKEESH